MHHVDTYVTKSMARHAQTYIDFCRNVAHGADRVWIEAKVECTNYIPDGFGTVDFAVLKGDVLHVIDLKYGKGVQVDADTPQAKYYAVALIDTFILKPKKVIVTIVQPRLDHISTQKFSFKEIMDFAETLRAASAEVDRMDERFKKKKTLVFKPGSHCGFCKARRQCRALYSYIVSHGPLATEGFTAMKTIPTGAKRDEWVNDKVNLLTDEELADYFVWADLAVRTSNAIKGMATSRAASGQQYDGLKLVAGRTSRDWLDVKAAKEALKKSGVSEDQLYQKKFVTVSQAERILGKKIDDDALVEKRPGKPALVTESDRRKEITTISLHDNTGFTD